MEIKEIVSHYLNHSNEALEVSFRTIDDDENELRSAEIPIAEIIAFGYDFTKGDSQILEMFDDEDTEDDVFGVLNSSDETIDSYELTQFLNEYYLVYPDQIPDKELF